MGSGGSGFGDGATRGAPSGLPAGDSDAGSVFEARIRARRFLLRRHRPAVVRLVVYSYRQLHWSAENRLGRLEQAGGVMTLDPLAKKGSGTRTSSASPCPLSPSRTDSPNQRLKRVRAEPLGYGCAQRRFHHGSGPWTESRTGLILPLRVYRHDALPANGRAHRIGASPLPSSRTGADQPDGMHRSKVSIHPNTPI